MNDVTHLREGFDHLIWCPDPKGIFSTKNVWELMHSKGANHPWFDWFWNPFLQKKISSTLWKVFHNALNVDLHTRGRDSFGFKMYVL